MLLRLSAVLFIARTALSQNPSPCPSIFAYEPKGAEDDRWYGRITVTTPEELNGIWLKVTLDRPAELLGNWFGEATSSDNRDYLIKNQQHRLQPNREPLSIRFFVKYSAGSRSIPSLTSIRLNGRVICPPGSSDSSGTTQSTLHISHLKPSENNNVVNQHKPSSSNDNNSGGHQSGYGRQTSHRTTMSTTSMTEASTDDDFFPGDFSGSRPTVVLNTHFGSSGNGGCGVVKTGARPLITFGQGTNEGEWPWHTALYRYKGANMQYICGGSLISPTSILTAAHCVTKSRTAIPISPELLVGYLGKYNLYKIGTTVQNVQITKITVHPEFNGTYLHNDLAVLHLEKAAEITDYVRTVCLWEDDVNINTVLEKLGTVVGWGFDQTGELTENLMMAKMPVVSTETCIFSNRDFFSRFTTAKTFCAGFRNGTSACTGDSGGGMVFPKSGTSGANTVWQLRGIISLSAALQNDKVVCDTSTYIVFTDVAKYLDWIRAAMNR